MQRISFVLDQEYSLEHNFLPLFKLEESKKIILIDNYLHIEKFGKYYDLEIFFRGKVKIYKVIKNNFVVVTNSLVSHLLVIKNDNAICHKLPGEMINIFDKYIYSLEYSSDFKKTVYVTNCETRKTKIYSCSEFTFNHYSISDGKISFCLNVHVRNMCIKKFYR